MIRVTLILILFNTCLFGQDTTFVKEICDEIQKLKDKNDFKGQLDIVQKHVELHVPELVKEANAKKSEQEVFNFYYRLQRELKRTCPGYLSVPSIPRGVRVLDLEDKFTKTEIDSLTKMLTVIGVEKNVYVHLVTVDDFYPYVSIEEFSKKNRTEWGSIYNFDKGSVLIVVSDTKRQIRIATSDAAMKYLTDEECTKLNSVIIPFFKQGDYFKGVLEGLVQMKELI